MTRGLFGDDKIRLEWVVPRVLMPKNLVKLILNLSVIAAGAIPRGGIVSVAATGPAEQPDIELKATGMAPRVHHALPGLLAGTPEGGILDAHAIQPYFTGLVARQVGYVVSFAVTGDTVTVGARPAGALAPAGEDDVSPRASSVA